MARDDLAANLEFWAGRARHDAAGDDPPRPQPSFRRRSFGPRRLAVPALRVPKLRMIKLRFPSSRLQALRGRARPIAAAVLLATLAGAWLIAGHASHGAPAVADATVPAVPPTTASVTTTSPTTVPPTTVPPTTVPPTTVPRTADCRGLAAARPVVRCVLDGIAVDVRLLTRATVAAAYRRATGTTPAAHTGAPACAQGRPDERAWSSPSAPVSAVGRYQCRLANGRAAMWWTDGARLVHAVAPDADLAALFAWWRAHPSE